MTGRRLDRRAVVLGGAALAVLPMAGRNGVAAAGLRGGERVVAIGGAVTEIVYALGEGHRLVGRDTTSRYPPQTEALPDVGYSRALSPEGVLSVAPDLILATEDAGPVETIEVLKASGVAYVTVPEIWNGAGIARKIAVVGEALGVPDRAGRLIAETQTRLGAAAGLVSDQTPQARQRVLFVLSLQGGRILAGGRDTPSAAIIEMAGGVNAGDGFAGFKQMTDEAVAGVAPDVILMMSRGGDHEIVREQLFSMPAIRTTPAGQSGTAIIMPGLYLLGFGPRTAEAVLDLNAAIYRPGEARAHDADPS